ncbi:MAG: DUF1467 family protein [Rhizobiales bacterium]|nr:DUF1467 family protein [Hyphomicrobiales bacterium]
MTLFAGLAIYAVTWWTVLFAVLPWGVVTQEENENVSPGTIASAPARPQMLKKVIATTLIAGVVWLGIYFLIVDKPISFDQIPFMPKMDGKY